MRTLFTTLVTSLVSCGLASAGTLTLNCTTGSSPLEFYSNTAPICPTFTLAGATLDSAQVTVNAMVSGTVNFFNFSESGAGDIQNAYAILVVKVFVVQYGEDQAFSRNNPLIISLQTVPETISPGTTSLPVTDDGSLVGPVLTITPGLAPWYEGAGLDTNNPGMFFLAGGIDTQSSIGGTNGPTFFPNMIQVGGVVTYTYSSASDVPEPGTLLTLGAALFGVAAAAFKRLRSS
jgi:hypothetical protein